MAPVFVYANGVYFNVNELETIKPNDGSGFTLRAKDRLVDTRNQSISEIVTQLVPTGTEYELLTPVTEEDGSISLSVEPVLAFGLNIFGISAPIVPSAMNGVFSGYALRKVGQAIVYSSTDGQFEDSEKWLAYLNKPQVFKAVG